jgi:DNA-directed RNA polymerase subunit beta'
LLGLKENVIIGKLIPAGTGMARYRNIRVLDPNEPEELEFEGVSADGDAIADEAQNDGEFAVEESVK